MFKLIYQTLTTTALLLAINHFSFAQTTFHSATGYDVSVGICPTNIVVSTSDCPWSYNYNVHFYYEVIFSNNPSNFSLNTLQTEIYCNGQSNGYYSLPVSGGNGMATSITNPSVNNVGGSPYNYGSRPDCQTANLSNLNCNSVKLKIQGPGIPMQTVDVVCSMTMAPLPVEFESFEAKSESNFNTLVWKVLSEKRNSFFTLYFSKEGTDWSFVTDVESLGDIETERYYDYKDTDSDHQVGYYKLVQTDLDGNWNELAIAYVNANYNGFKLSPNPSNGMFTLDFQAKNSESMVTILSQEGKTLYARNSHFAGIKNGYYFHEVFDEKLAPGVYFVQITAQNQVVRTEKLVIQ